MGPGELGSSHPSTQTLAPDMAVQPGALPAGPPGTKRGGPLAYASLPAREGPAQALLETERGELDRLNLQLLWEEERTGGKKCSLRSR